MKKLPLSLLLLFILSQSYSQKPPPCGLMRNRIPEFLWTDSIAERYITFYRRNYDRKWEMHTRAIYMNNKAFLFLDSFLNAKEDYVGFNLHFCVYEARMAYGQQYDDQFSIYFTPTKDEDILKSDYVALKQFYESLQNPNLFPLKEINHSTVCPGFCDSTTANWGPSVDHTSRVSVIGVGHEGILIDNPAALKDYKSNYRKKTTALGIPNKRHTKSTFIDDDKIGRIACFLKEGSNQKDFPAIGIYFASYNEKKKVPTQAKKKQITVGFVPMKKIGANLEPDPCSYVRHVVDCPHCAPMIAALQATRKEEQQSENHSELCPEKCPKEDAPGDGGPM